MSKFYELPKFTNYDNVLKNKIVNIICENNYFAVNEIFSQEKKNLIFYLVYLYKS